jgi:hypothetical protein
MSKPSVLIEDSSLAVPGDMTGGGSGASSTPRPPLVWLLLGRFEGDNAQVRSIGEALPWPVEAKTVFFPSRGAPYRKTRAAVDARVSSEIAPPWPDLIITCGRFYCRLAQWIKVQSGGRTRHVQMGRIGNALGQIDLMLSLPQYGIPQAKNVVPLTLPIVRVSPARQAESACHWQPLLADLPRPWTLALVGGPAMTIGFEAADARRLLRRIDQVQTAEGGSVLVVYGHRTPAAVKAVLEAGLASRRALPHKIISWPPPDPNPYQGLLALADRFIVTCDSVSMIADASLTGRPSEIFMLAIAPFKTRLSSRGLGLSLDARRRRRQRANRPDDILDRLRDWLVAKNLMRPWDDLRDVLHRLEHTGLARPGTGPDAAVVTIDMASAVTLQQRELDLIKGRIIELMAAAPRHPA